MTIFNLRRSSQFVPCQTSYPAARQASQKATRTGLLATHPVYIWEHGSGNYNNPALIDYQPDQCGNGQTCADYIKRGRDYITGSPKPAYTEYPYPHPLRGSHRHDFRLLRGLLQAPEKQAHPHPSANP